MDTKLDQVQDWPERARLAKYSVSMLAKHCGVSVRTLERHFKKEKAKTVKKWLAERRQIDGWEILQKNPCIKAAAANVGYKHTQHFSRDFKAHWGHCPAEMITRQT
jgi:AraC family transcriptional regulator, carnitine catabolism transcriptional activator